MSAHTSSRSSARFSIHSRHIGQLLVENGDVQPEQVTRALEIQERQGGLLGHILCQMGACNAEAVAAALIKQVQITDVPCEDLTVPADVLALVGAEHCEAEKLCPFERLGSLLCIVMGNPLNRDAINAIERRTQLRVKAFKAPWPAIKELLDRSAAAAAARIAPVAQASSLHGETSNDARATPAPAPPPQPPAPAPVAQAPSLHEQAGSDARATPTPTPPPFWPQRPQPPKINVDLDKLDVTKAVEVIETGEKPGDELLLPVRLAAQSGTTAPGARGAPEPQAAQAPAAVRTQAGAPGPQEALPRFTPAPLADFYAGGAAPAQGEPPPKDLVALLATLPVAETIAESAAEYAQGCAPTAPSGWPLEWSPAPKEPLRAAPLAEAEFHERAAELRLDPAGEWVWTYAESGPVAVVEYAP
jgi:hypothetical protein